MPKTIAREIAAKGTQRRRTAVIKHPLDPSFVAVVKLDVTRDSENYSDGEENKSITVEFPNGDRVTYYERTNDDALVIRRDGVHTPEVHTAERKMHRDRTVSVTRVAYGSSDRD